MKAFILIKTKARAHSDVAARLRKVEGVLHSFPVMGRADVVAAVEVDRTRQVNELSELALRIGRTPGVVTTETLIGLER